MTSKALSGLTHVQILEFLRRLGRAGFNAELVREINHDGEENALARAIYRGLVSHPSFGRIHGMFTTPEHQIRKIQQWNQQYGWNIPAEFFAEAGRTIPVWPEEELVAVVLVPYLTDIRENHELVMTGMERTFRELVARAMAEQKHGSTMCHRTDKDHLRLYQGGRHRPGLRWEVIDVGLHRNRASAEMRSVAESPPSAGILAAAALHPEWVKSMGHVHVPSVWIPGYEVFNSEEGWARVPIIMFVPDCDKIEINIFWSDAHGAGDCVPSFVTKRKNRKSYDSRDDHALKPRAAPVVGKHITQK